MAKRDLQPFLNHESGTFSPTSKEWVLRADQWSQTYYVRLSTTYRSGIPDSVRRQATAVA